nr:hypothetical protein [Tanacetum cinerariifolium]
MSSDNASSAVTYTSISSDSDGPSWSIPLMDVGELSEIDPYEESLGYIVDSESMEEDFIDYLDEPEDEDEDSKEDPEEDHTDYPADGGDGDDKPSDDEDDDDDTNDEYEEPTDNEEEEEHLALADSSVVPVVDHVTSAGDTEAFETDDSSPIPKSPQTRVLFSPTCLRRARKTVRLEPPMSASMKARIAEHAAAPTPPPPRHPSPAYDQAPLGHRAAMIYSYGAAARPPRGQYDFVNTVENHACNKISNKCRHDSRIHSSYDRSGTPKNSTHTQDDGSQSLGGGLRRPVQPAHLEKMESLFHISGCTVDNKVKFSSCTLLGAALTWWNGHKLRTYVERQNDIKRKANDSLRNNQQQQPHKKQNVARAYTAGPGEKKAYTRNLPLCTNAITTTSGNVHPSMETARGIVIPPVIVGNGNGDGVAQIRAYALGGRDSSPNSNVITGTFLLNNRYALILFDTGADRSFISTTFSALMDITPTTLENNYDVELANGKTIGVNTIIQGCTLNFMNHPFNIDLMHVPLSSFDIIIRMDWLTKYHGVIICDKKIIRVPLGREIKPKTSQMGNDLRKCRLSKIPEVFLEDLSGVTPARQVEFQIDLVSGVALVARAAYRLAPSEMKELAEQL